ncbi:BACON domain-containing protein [Streptomyces sp. NBC_01497]|uniref:BACON domain-containing protein n=1 Tax=Streptomyces sp. NBC_01497 TaxID=2903885 RepID=UPI002E34EE10|nr:hypothetical protein [Streptomyces sp. NBC_01497]
MTSSSPDTSLHSSGAHHAPHRAPRVAAPRPPARYEPYLDGLFTYCLSVLCEHAAAMQVLGEVLAISERQYGRSPTAEAERKAWLYALARWACLRRLARQRAGRHVDQGGSRGGTHAQAAAGAASRTGGPGIRSGHRAVRKAQAPLPGAVPAGQADPAAEELQRRELALLAWPEAAGTTPEQREVLELAVRHQLGPQGVAAVLSMEPTAARGLLSTAAIEVERTRAALAVVETGACPSVARLTADSGALLSATLRRELVRHVDDCPRCRHTAERVEAAGPWPGTTPRAGRRAPAVLPLVEVDRAVAYAAMLHAPTTRATAPRFGRDGFPLDPRDRAARRDRLRSRAVTTTVVATVIAAPVFAMWAAYRGAPDTGEGHGGPSVSAGDPGEPSSHDGKGYDRFENAGSASERTGARRADGGHGAQGSDVSVKVVSNGTGLPAGRPGAVAPGALGIVAETSSGRTTITLTASGAPVAWAASVGAGWISLSRSSGTLAPGRSVTLYVSVDHAREPVGPWSVRIALHPTGAVVLVDGYGYPQDPPGGGSGGGGGRPGRSGGHGGHGGGHHGGGGTGPGRPGGSSGSPGSPSSPGGTGDPGTGGTPSDPGTPSGGTGSGTGGSGGGSGTGGTGTTDPTSPASGGTTPDPPATPPSTTDDPGTPPPSAS